MWLRKGEGRSGVCAVFEKRRGEKRGMRCGWKKERGEEGYVLWLRKGEGKSGVRDVVGKRRGEKWGL